MSDVKTMTQRETYSLFDLCGDVGGLLEFVHIFATPFISVFSSIKMASLLTNRLYTWRSGPAVKERLDGELAIQKFLAVKELCYFVQCSQGTGAGFVACLVCVNGV